MSCQKLRCQGERGTDYCAQKLSTHKKKYSISFNSFSCLFYQFSFFLTNFVFLFVSMSLCQSVFLFLGTFWRRSCQSCQRGPDPRCSRLQRMSFRTWKKRCFFNSIFKIPKKDRILQILEVLDRSCIKVHYAKQGRIHGYSSRVRVDRLPQLPQ